MWAPEGVAGRGVSSRPSRGTSSGRGGASHTGAQIRLTKVILTHPPLAVAVIGTGARLLFWNEQAAGLFGAPPFQAADRPLPAEILTNANHLAPPQRDRIVAFAAMHIAAGDRTEPNSLLRTVLSRHRRRYQATRDRLPSLAGDHRQGESSAVNVSPRQLEGCDRFYLAVQAALGMIHHRRGRRDRGAGGASGGCGCNDIQGYRIGPPIPATEIKALLRQIAPATDPTTTE
jgi:hypothetical protein